MSSGTDSGGRGIKTSSRALDPHASRVPRAAKRARCHACPVCKGPMREAHGMIRILVCADRDCAPRFYEVRP
jgi:hypothetical protein